MQIAAAVIKSQHPQAQIKNSTFKIPFTFTSKPTVSLPESNGIGRGSEYEGYTDEEIQEYIRNKTHEARARWRMMASKPYVSPPPRPN